MAGDRGASRWAEGGSAAPTRWLGGTHPVGGRHAARATRAGCGPGHTVDVTARRRGASPNESGAPHPRVRGAGGSVRVGQEDAAGLAAVPPVAGAGVDGVEAAGVVAGVVVAGAAGLSDDDFAPARASLR